MNSYSQKVDQLKELFLSTPRIADFRVDTNPPITEGLLRILRETFNVQFSDRDLTFFTFSDGITFEWKYKDESELVYGGVCNILSLLDTVARPIDIYYLDEWGDRGELVKFDTFEKSSEFSKYTLLAIHESSTSLWFWDEDGDKYPLDLNMSTYVEQALFFKGVLDWQYFGIDLNKMKREREYWAYGTTLDSTLQRMKSLIVFLYDFFPEEDLSLASKKIIEVEHLNL